MRRKRSTSNVDNGGANEVGDLIAFQKAARTAALLLRGTLDDRPAMTIGFLETATNQELTVSAGYAATDLKRGRSVSISTGTPAKGPMTLQAVPRRHSLALQVRFARPDRPTRR